MSISLSIYHQTPVPATYILSKLELSSEFWRLRNIVKCSRVAKAVANHNLGCPQVGAKRPNVTAVEKISGLTGIQTQGLRNTAPALYHRGIEPHVD